MTPSFYRFLPRFEAELIIAWRLEWRQELLATRHNIPIIHLISYLSVQACSRFRFLVRMVVCLCVSGRSAAVYHIYTAGRKTTIVAG